jgi:hypothetical protein
LDSTTLLISIKATNIKKGIFQINKDLIAYLNIKVKDAGGTTRFSFVEKKTTALYYNCEDKAA